MSDAKDAGEFVSDAYQLDDKTDMVEFYRKWAADYDHKMLDGLGYMSPTRIAELLSQYLPDNQARVFDIGCGTGLTCRFLHEKGYVNLDGIDISPEMVGVAGERGIYRELLVGDVDQPLPLEDNSYDAVISSGTFTHGHVGPEPLDEIFRILKPAGWLACTVHQDLWESRGFEAKLSELVEQGRAECRYLEMEKYYQSGQPEGWFCIYQKTL